MMDYLKKQLEAGSDLVTIMNVGGNMQVALKVKVEAADALGIVARVKGLMGASVSRNSSRGHAFRR